MSTPSPRPTPDSESSDDDVPLANLKAKPQQPTPVSRESDEDVDPLENFEYRDSTGQIPPLTSSLSDDIPLADLKRPEGVGDFTRFDSDDQLLADLVSPSKEPPNHFRQDSDNIPLAELKQRQSGLTEQSSQTSEIDIERPSERKPRQWISPRVDLTEPSSVPAQDIQVHIERRSPRRKPPGNFNYRPEPDTQTPLEPVTDPLQDTHPDEVAPSGRDNQENNSRSSNSGNYQGTIVSKKSSSPSQEKSGSSGAKRALVGLDADGSKPQELEHSERSGPKTRRVMSRADETGQELFSIRDELNRKNMSEGPRNLQPPAGAAEMINISSPNMGGIAMATPPLVRGPFRRDLSQDLRLRPNIPPFGPGPFQHNRFGTQNNIMLGMPAFRGPSPMMGPGRNLMPPMQPPRIPLSSVEVPSVPRENLNTDDPTDVKNWTVGDVVVWLMQINNGQLGKYAEHFKRHHVNGSLLLQLTETEFSADLQISSLGHRRVLAEAIQELTQGVCTAPRLILHFRNIQAHRFRSINSSLYDNGILSSLRGGIWDFLTWQPKSRYPVLLRLSGSLQPKKLTAFMGSLENSRLVLQILSGHDIGSDVQVSGEILANGQQWPESLYRYGISKFLRFSKEGCLEQWDSLSIGEVITFCARIGPGRRNKSLSERVDLVFEFAQLNKPRNYKVRNLSESGKRRLLVAMEGLLSGCRAIFLDLPLMYMSSVEVVDMLKLLRKVSNMQNLICVLSIDNIKKAFLEEYIDDVYLIGDLPMDQNPARRGQLRSVWFQGSPVNIQPFFKSLKIPFGDRDANPLDVVIDFVRQKPELIYEISKTQAKIKREPAQAKVNAHELGHKSVNGVVDEYLTLLLFFLPNSYRDMSILNYHLGFYIFWTLLLCNIMYHLDASLQTAEDRAKTIALFALFPFYTAWIAFHLRVRDRVWLADMCYAQRIRSWVVMLVLFTVAIVDGFLSGILTLCPWWLAGLSSENLSSDMWKVLAIQTLAGALVSILSSSFMECFPPSANPATVAACLLLLLAPFGFVTGVWISPDLMTFPAMILSRINFMKFATEALVMTGMSGLDDSKQTVIEQFWFHDHFFLDVVYLGIWLAAVTIFMFLSAESQLIVRIRNNTQHSLSTDDSRGIEEAPREPSGQPALANLFRPAHSRVLTNLSHFGGGPQIRPNLPLNRFPPMHSHLHEPLLSRPPPQPMGRGGHIPNHSWMHHPQFVRPPPQHPGHIQHLSLPPQTHLFAANPEMFQNNRWDSHPGQNQDVFASRRTSISKPGNDQAIEAINSAENSRKQSQHSPKSSDQKVFETPESSSRMEPNMPMNLRNGFLDLKQHHSLENLPYLPNQMSQRASESLPPFGGHPPNQSIPLPIKEPNSENKDNANASSVGSETGSSSEEYIAPLQFYDLFVWQNNRLQLENVSGKLRSGQVTGFMGTSNIHKNILLEVLIGSSRERVSVTGRILFEGQELRETLPLVQKKIVGFVPCNPPLPDFMTVQAAVTFAVRIQHPKSDRKLKRMVENILDDVGLVEIKSELIGSLEDSDRVKAAIAYYGLCATSEVLVAEHPLRGLSRQEAKYVLETLQYLAENRKLAVALIEDPIFTGGLYRYVNTLVFLAKISEASQIVYDGETHKSPKAFFDQELLLTHYENFSEEIIDVMSRSDQLTQMSLGRMVQQVLENRKEPEFGNFFQCDDADKNNSSYVRQVLLVNLLGLQWLVKNSIFLRYAVGYGLLSLCVVSMFQIPSTSSGVEALRCLILVYLSGHCLTNMQEYPLLQPLFKLASEDVFHGKYAAWVFALVLGCLQLVLKFLSAIAITLSLIIFTPLRSENFSDEIGRAVGVVYAFICVGFFFDSILYPLQCWEVARTFNFVIMAQLIAIFAMFSGILLSPVHVPVELSWLYRFNPIRFGVDEILGATIWWSDLQDDSPGVAEGTIIHGSELLGEGGLTGTTILLLLSIPLRFFGSTIMASQNSPAQFKEPAVDVNPIPQDEEFMRYLSNEDEKTEQTSQEDEEEDEHPSEASYLSEHQKPTGVVDPTTQADELLTDEENESDDDEDDEDIDDINTDDEYSDEDEDDVGSEDEDDGDEDESDSNFGNHSDSLSSGPDPADEFDRYNR